MSMSSPSGTLPGDSGQGYYDNTYQPQDPNSLSGGSGGGSGSGTYADDDDGWYGDDVDEGGWVVQDDASDQVLAGPFASESEAAEYLQKELTDPGSTGQPLDSGDYSITQDLSLQSAEDPEGSDLQAAGPWVAFKLGMYDAKPGDRVMVDFLSHLEEGVVTDENEDGKLEVTFDDGQATWYWPDEVTTVSPREGRVATIGTPSTIPGPHCESCGNQDYEDLHGGDGYTACCNELVCDGGLLGLYGTPERNTRACCWAAAQLVGVNEGSRAHHDDEWSWRQGSDEATPGRANRYPGRDTDCVYCRMGDHDQCAGNFCDCKDEGHQKYPKAGSRTATNWMLDGTPIEGGFEVQGEAVGDGAEGWRENPSEDVWESGGMTGDGIPIRPVGIWPSAWSERIEDIEEPAYVDQVTPFLPHPEQL